MYVYGFENEVINVVETNIENISNYIANVYYSNVSINQSLDVVNLLVKEEETLASHIKCNQETLTIILRYLPNIKN